LPECFDPAADSLLRFGVVPKRPTYLFQQTAGSFAPVPPVPGVGPGALADPSGFLAELEGAGISASVETETTGFAFEDFSSAWDVLAGVTTAQLPLERQQEAKAAVRAKMWPEGDGPRHFRNLTQFIVGIGQQRSAVAPVFNPETTP